MLLRHAAVAITFHRFSCLTCLNRFCFL